mgnify:FL=1|jgi:glutamate racemase
MINQHPDFINNPNEAPIGVFDSGVGGLSVYQHLRQLLPNERFIYYADTKNVPYGDKSGDEILLLTLQAVARLCKRGCKLIVIACNSASAYALTAIRQRCSVPVVGLVPAVKPACKLTQTKKIAVLATKATLNGYLLNEVINEVAIPNGVTVFKHFEPSLVPWVEQGMPIDSQVANLLIYQTHLWAKAGVDVVVLGCTHYPFFKSFLQDEINKKNLAITLVDSGFAIAQRVQSLLKIFNIASQEIPNLTQNPPLQLYATQLTDELLMIVKTLTNQQTIIPIFSQDENILSL